ncbi:hypothetical protein K3495_g11958 [Podosphaera aphanis]|nr:hypothetical protein K3495_g11958 [Podosphaera aphanis]
MSRDELLVLRKTLTELLDKNWIRASSSPGGAPVLFIRKQGGGLRLCVDYRALNAVTERDRYPLPLIKETLRMMSQATWLSKVDVRAAFHRLCIAQGDEYKTAFRTRFGAYEWLVTPFGLAGAPAAFQRWINKVLGDLLGDTCAAYLDDVVIFSNGDLVDHWIKVNQVVSRLAEAGLKLDPKKYEFAKKEIKYLGFIICVTEGIKPDPEKVCAITEWERPTDIKGIRSFLGFANFYRNFIENFAQLTAPLHDLTRKGTLYKWSAEHQKAFEELRRRFKTDSSGWATGACLSQYSKEGSLRPVAYHSKKLTPTECKYDIHDKELLSIVRSLEEWRGELTGLHEPFIILTDHKNLEFFMTAQKLSERQVRWAQLSSQFNFKIKFRAGKQAARPDALSRRAQDLPKSPDDPRLKEREFQLLRTEWLNKEKPEEATLLAPIVLVSSAKPEEAQNIPEGKQLFLEKVLEDLWNEGEANDASMFEELYKAMWQNERALPPGLGIKVSLAECELDPRGALCFRKRLWIPNWEPLQTALIQKTHDSHVTGHPGRNNTLAILSRSFFWPGMSTMVRKFCQNCDVCGRSHVWRSKRQGFLLPLPIPNRFHSELSVDFMTDMPSKKRGDPRYLMVITDRLLKSVTLEAMESMNAEDCAKRFINCHYRFHGFPHAITSDRGTNWVGDFWRRVCQLTNIEQRLSTSFHAETDGATERMNQEVLAYLRAFISFAQYEWPSLLPSAQLATNNRDSSSTGLSPFFIEHVYHVEPVQQYNKLCKEDRSAPAKRAEIFVNRIREAQEYAVAAMVAAQQRMEEQANRARNPSRFSALGIKYG